MTARHAAIRLLNTLALLLTLAIFAAACQGGVVDTGAPEGAPEEVRSAASVSNTDEACDSNEECESACADLGEDRAVCFRERCICFTRRHFERPAIP